MIAGLASAPALAMILVPGATVGAPVAFGLAGFGGCYAMLNATRTRIAQHINETRLLRRAALAPARAEAPDLPARRAALERALVPLASARGKSGPPTRDDLRAATLRDVMSGYDATCPAELDPVATIELCTLLQVLDGSPQEAGRLSVLFRVPHAVLDLRARLAAAHRLRCLYDVQTAAYEATRTLWRLHGGGAGICDLSVPDPDLTHHVLLQCDLQDGLLLPEVLRLARLPATDAASVAGFLARCCDTGVLERALDDPHAARIWHEALSDIARLWNGAAYSTSGLGLSQPDCAVAQAPRLAALRRALADSAKLPFDEDFRGLAQSFEGRAPLPRPAWSLRTLTLHAAPDPMDYRPEPEGPAPGPLAEAPGSR